MFFRCEARTAGPTVVFSSVPSSPPSPAWGFRPQTATRGVGILYGAANSYELTLGRQTSGDLDLVSFLVNDASDGSPLRPSIGEELV